MPICVSGSCIRCSGIEMLYYWYMISDIQEQNTVISSGVVCAGMLRVVAL